MHSRRQAILLRRWFLASPLHTSLHTAVRHRHAVRVHLLMGESIGILHALQKIAYSLGVTHRAVFMLDEQVSKVPNLVM